MRALTVEEEITASIDLEDNSHAGMILCCEEHGTPLRDGVCPKCGFVLDMQSTYFEFVNVEAEIDYHCRVFVRERCRIP